MGKAVNKTQRIKLPVVYIHSHITHTILCNMQRLLKAVKMIMFS